MIDKKLIIENKQYIKQELEKKGYDIEYVDAIKKLLLEIRSQTTKLNEQNQRRNKLSLDKSVSAEEKRKLRKRIVNNEKDLKALEKYCNRLLLDVPNLPDAQAPVGTDDSGNVIIYESSEYYKCTATTPLPHWELADALDILDPAASGAISGSGFSIFKGMGAKLLRALINYGLSINEDKYTEIIPPHLVISEAMTHTGHLPKFANQQYKSEKDDLWLIPTAEVPLTAALANTVTPHDKLPLKYMGYSIAFRRESGAAGRDTRGLQRVHEFHKVELLKIVAPEMVDFELQDLLKDCIAPIEDLKLRYRLVDLCTGDMGDKYARCFDIEVYSPGINKWLEVASVGHFSDYQARRANIRYSDSRGRKRLAFTMNGSGLATPRVWLSIVETYQQPDGSIKIPDVLIPFMGCEAIEAGT